MAKYEVDIARLCSFFCLSILTQEYFSHWFLESRREGRRIGRERGREGRKRGRKGGKRKRKEEREGEMAGREWKREKHWCQRDTVASHMHPNRARDGTCNPRMCPWPGIKPPFGVRADALTTEWPDRANLFFFNCVSNVYFV